MKCGFYEREITPPLGTDIPGYFGARRSTNIHDPLFVKAAAINTGERIEDTVILIVLDLVRVPPTLYDKALQKIEDLTRVPKKNILVAVTHSHTGGPIYPDDERRRQDPIWLESTTQSAADCAIMAFRSMKPATARIAEGKVENQAFCRDYLMQNGEIRTNPGLGNPMIVRPWGKTDPAFPVVFFHDEEGKPFGALTNFACHHDCKGGTETSADYSGVLAREMKQTFGPGFINILFAGACGNITSGNHMAKEKRKHKGFLEVGWALADEQRKLYDQTEVLNLDKVDAVKKVLPIKRREVTPERVEEAHWMMENVPIDPYQLSLTKTDSVMYKRYKAEAIIKHAAEPSIMASMVQVIKLGDLAIYALNGEIYCEYGLYIKEHSKAKYNIICTLSNKGAGGYVPTPDVFGTTVYPAQLPSSPLIPEAGQMIVDLALEIADELY